jgi:hypothetical protein
VLIGLVLIGSRRGRAPGARYVVDFVTLGRARAHAVELLHVVLPS